MPNDRETSFDAFNSETQTTVDNTFDAPYAKKAPSTSTTERRASLKLISTNYGLDGGAKIASGTGGWQLIPKHQARWFERCIDPDLALRFGVHSHASGAIAFHYIQDGAIYNTKIRHGKGNMPWSQKREPLIFWNVDSLKPNVEPDEFAIITEGEPDALSCLQVGFSRVVSLPNGAQVGNNGYKFMFLGSGDDILPDLQKFSDIVVALDNDSKGVSATERIIDNLDTIRCRVPTYPEGCKDANEVLVRHGPEKLRECIFGARHVWRGEICRLSDVSEPGQLVRHTCGVPGLDQHGFRIVTPGLWSIVGPYGSGKSVLLRQVLVHLWRTYGWRFLLTALEERVKHRLQNSLQKQLCKGLVSDATADEIAAVNEEIESCVRFLIRPRRVMADPAWLINRIEIALKREDVKVVAIDPINQIDQILGRGENYTDFMGRFLIDLQRIADDYKVLMIVAAHPDKFNAGKRNWGRHLLTLNDASGTAHFGNKSDIGWCVWRPHRDGPSVLHIDKLKDEENMGKRTVAKLYMTEAREQFTADVIGYQRFFNDGKEQDNGTSPTSYTGLRE